MLTMTLCCAGLRRRRAGGLLRADSVVIVWGGWRGTSTKVSATGTCAKNVSIEGKRLPHDVVPADFLLTIKGLREYRDHRLRPLVQKKRTQLLHMTEIKTKCEVMAQRYVDKCALLLFTLLTAQALTLFYWVYFLFDWNLVEPITYLLGYGGVWICLACYGVTQKDLSYAALQQVITERRVGKLYRTHNVDVDLWRQLAAEVDLLEARMRGLEGL